MVWRRGKKARRKAHRSPIGGPCVGYRTIVQQHLNGISGNFALVLGVDEELLDARHVLGLNVSQNQVLIAGEAELAGMEAADFAQGRL